MIISVVSSQEANIIHVVDFFLWLICTCLEANNGSIARTRTSDWEACSGWEPPTGRALLSTDTTTSRGHSINVHLKRFFLSIHIFFIYELVCRGSVVCLLVDFVPFAAKVVLMQKISTFAFKVKLFILHPRIPRLFSGKNWFWAKLSQFKGYNASKYAKMTILLVWLFVVSFKFSHLLIWTSYLWHQTIFWSKNDVRELYFFCSNEWRSFYWMIQISQKRIGSTWHNMSPCLLIFGTKEEKN